MVQRKFPRGGFYLAKDCERGGGVVNGGSKVGRSPHRPQLTSPPDVRGTTYGQEGKEEISGQSPNSVRQIVNKIYFTILH